MHKYQEWNSLCFKDTSFSFSNRYSKNLCLGHFQRVWKGQIALILNWKNLRSFLEGVVTMEQEGKGSNPNLNVSPLFGYNPSSSIWIFKSCTISFYPLVLPSSLAPNSWPPPPPPPALWLSQPTHLFKAHFRSHLLHRDICPTVIALARLNCSWLISWMLVLSSLLVDCKPPKGKDCFRSFFCILHSAQQRAVHEVATGYTN